MTVAAREPKTATVWANVDPATQCRVLSGLKHWHFVWLPNQTKLRSASALLETKSVPLVFHAVTLCFLASCSLPPLHNSRSYSKGMMVGGVAKVSMSTRGTRALCWYAGELWGGEEVKLVWLCWIQGSSSPFYQPHRGTGSWIQLMMFKQGSPGEELTWPCGLGSPSQFNV